MPQAWDKYGRAFKKGVDKEATKAAERLGEWAGAQVIEGITKASPHIGERATNAVPRIRSLAGRGKDLVRKGLVKTPGIVNLLERRARHSSAPNS